MEKQKLHQYGAPKTSRFAQHWCFFFFVYTLFNTSLAFDYADALTKSLLYFEAQRSGRLPYNQRVTWRDNSGLTDGLEQGVSMMFTAICIKLPK